MTRTAILTPAYGRDYKSKKAVMEDLLARKDFVLHDLMSVYDGKVCNLDDLRRAGYTSVHVRYDALRKVLVIEDIDKI
jgi:hypothetical protein